MGRHYDIMTTLSINKEYKMKYICAMNEDNAYELDLFQLCQVLSYLGIKYILLNNQASFYCNDEQLDDILNHLPEFEDFGIMDLAQCLNAVEI